jgi:hypothetical protein
LSRYLAAIEFAFSRDKKEDESAILAVRVLMPCFEREIIFREKDSITSTLAPELIKDAGTRRVGDAEKEFRRGLKPRLNSSH